MTLMEKNIRIGNLLSVYGELLPEKQRTVIDLACNEDLSLSEISESSGITRQGVHDSIRRGEMQLETFEDSLHILRDSRERCASLEQLRTLLLAVMEGDTPERLQQAVALVDTLLDKEE